MNYKIAFIQRTGTTQHGIMILSAVLKESGFRTDVFSMEIERENIVHKVVQYQPNMICFTMTTPDYQKMSALIKELKSRIPSIFIVVGGAHPTFYPKMIEREKDVDAICVGEGEYPLLELAESIRNKKIEYKIRNLWIRKGNTIIKNDIRDLIKDLDVLPFPDRDIYFKKYPYLAKKEIKFNVGRGCPCNCSYCFNKGIKELYRGKGSWVRLKSVDRIIAEIKSVDSQYPIETVSINDDTFNMNRKWLKSFLLSYKKEVNKPFLCALRIDFTSKEQVDQLKWAGVDRIGVGIEHGNEEIRKKILSRNMSNELIINFGKWARDNKIRIITSNLIGLPGETLEMAYETIELNAKLRPEIAVPNVLSPYPGTEIFSYLQKNGYLREGFSFDEMTGQYTGTLGAGNKKVSSEIKNDFIPAIINLSNFFMLLIYYPQLKPLVNLLIKVPNNPLYQFIGRLTGQFKMDWRYSASWKDRIICIRRLFALG